MEREEGGDDGNGNGDRWNQRGAAAAEEKVDHQHDEADGQGEGEIDFADRAFDEHGGVVALADFHALGQCGSESEGFGFDGAGDIDGVRGGLFDDAEADHRNGISAENGAGFVRLAIDACDFAEADQVAVLAAFERELAEVLGGFERPVGADGEGALAGFDGAGGKFDVFG